MKLKHRIAALSSILSTVYLAGCNFNGNTNMQTSNKKNCVKWDQFANYVGTQTCDQAVPVTNKNALIESMTVPPKNMLPNGDKYNQVKSEVANYVKQMAYKMQATEIVSIKKLSDILTEAGFSDQLIVNSGIISVPYYERDTLDNKGNVIEKGSYQDLSGIKTLSGIDENSNFEIYGTLNGKVDRKNIAKGTVYVLTYKLNNSSQKYSAIVTIPNNPNVKANTLPLMMYAHGGDVGLSFRNMATILQNNLSKAIVAAPSFPGELICSITTKVGNSENNYLRSCGDADGNVIKALVTSEGDKSPLDDDVNSLLGLQNAISKLSQKMLIPNKVEAEESTVNSKFVNDLSQQLAFYSQNPFLKIMSGPITIGVADSRGGATLMAAIGRSGVMLEQMLQGGFDMTSIASLPKPALFSSAALYYSPSSLLVGSFKVLTQYMMSGSINETSTYNALPMIPDLKINSYFTNYKNAETGNDEAELKSLVGWLASSDIVFLAPYLSVGMQNWKANIDSIEKVLNNQIEKFLIDIGKIKLDTEGKDTVSNVLGELLVTLSKPTSLENPKSLLNYFADRLNDGNDLDALKNLFGTNDDQTIKAFVNFLNILGNKDIGLYNISEVLIGNSRHTLNSLLTLYYANEELKKITKLNLFDKNTDSLQKFLLYFSQVSYTVSLNNQDTYHQTAGNLVEKITKLYEYQSVLSNSEFKLALTEKLNSLTKNVLSEKKSSPGSIIFLHATQDAVVPFSQSIIAKSAMDNVFDAVYAKPVDGFPNSLIEYGIPALGSQLFAFQPDQKFYNIPVGSAGKDGSVCLSKNDDGTTPANYSPLVNKCFGNEKPGDGVLAHGDSALRTSHLVNGPLQKLDNLTSKIDVHNSFLFGNNTYDPISKISTKSHEVNVKAQFVMYNTMSRRNDFYISDCQIKTKTGICYVNDPSSKMPLFHRPMFLDIKQKESMFYGQWDDTAQNSLMTPTDILDAWMDSSVQSIMNIK